MPGPPRGPEETACWIATVLVSLVQYVVLGLAMFIMPSDAPGLASSHEAKKPKPWLDKPSQAKLLASGRLWLWLEVPEAKAKASSPGFRGLEKNKSGTAQGEPGIQKKDLGPILFFLTSAWD